MFRDLVEDTMFLPVSEAVKVKRILGARHCEIERITAD